jgi:hypothetical protein
VPQIIIRESPRQRHGAWCGKRQVEGGNAVISLAARIVDERLPVLAEPFIEAREFFSPRKRMLRSIELYSSFCIVFVDAFPESSASTSAAIQLQSFPNLNSPLVASWPATSLAFSTVVGSPVANVQSLSTRASFRKR